MHLLERDEELGVLAAARDAAAGGRGRVVLVTGEPGIGKTWLVRRAVLEAGTAARVLVGTCDDLSTPRPLGPIRDLAGSVSGPLATALQGGAPPHEVQSLLTLELGLPPAPTVLVIEDAHWADDATIDIVTLLGRRIANLPAVLVLTFRAGEVPSGHRLHAAIGSMRAEDVDRLELAPLSERAVAALAGREAARVYAATGGNPFYVAELLASPANAIPPPSVANAVLGRAARLSAPARELLELVSIVPGRISTSLLEAMLPDWAERAAEPERRQLLEVGTSHVSFRHELARHAIASDLPVATRRRMHAGILDVLLERGADPADIVHHAEAAGAGDVVARHALVAARHARSLDSHREAHSHYRRIASVLAERPLPEQALLLEEVAWAAYLAGRIAEAFGPIERAIGIHRDLDDHLGLGRCTRVLSRFHWFVGDGVAARSAALDAAAILEPLGPSEELARAFGSLALLDALAQDVSGSLAWSERALELATMVGDDLTRIQSMVNIGTARAQLDPAAVELLEASHRAAEECGLHYEAARSLINATFALLSWLQAGAALGCVRRAREYSEQHEVFEGDSYSAALVALLELRAGEWDRAEEMLVAVADSTTTVFQLIAATVLAELAVRRGDADADERLADAFARAERTGELQRIVPVLELMVEHALLNGTAMPVGAFHSIVAHGREGGRLAGWSGQRLAAWAAVAGIEPEIDPAADAAHEVSPSPLLAAMIRRDWRAAAAGFAAQGWTYDRALMLSMLDDEMALVEAIEIARSLGAEPLARRVAGRMRERDLRVPVGARRTTRANPAGLTSRQVEVLALMVEGLTNGEIAERLYVSPRTAEHHVAAVMLKLGVTSRRDAAREGAALGIGSRPLR